jgi:hypothetical protein
MNKFILQLFLAVVFLGGSLQATAATVTWDGGASTSNWTDALNWSTDALPTMSDDVDLNGATVVLTANTQVQRVYAGGSAQLTINTGVTLTISGFAGNDDGLEVQTSATVINNGTIAISSINTGSTDADGLYSKGTFTNNGTITIDGTGQHGIYLQGGTFTNNAGKSITVANYGQGDSDADGMYVDDNGGAASTFNNNGMLTITMTGSDDGIYINDGSIINNTSMITIGGSAGDNGIRIDDAGAFNNNAGGTLTINSTPDDQLFLDNTGTFTNTGTVNLNNASDVGLYVTDAGVFTNSATGAVNISSASNYAIQIDANGSTANIVNSATITITGGSNDGIRLQEAGVFNNNAGGTLSITNAGDEGIQVDDGASPVSTFNNSGSIIITTATDHGMENFGTFNNLMGGSFQALNCTDDGIRMRNAGIFNNDGAIHISGSGSEDIETDGTTFTNTANATFTPGNNVGIMEIKDDFNLGSATVTFEIPDTTSGSFDQIQNFSAGTAITITNAKAHLDWGSYIPSVGFKFKIIDGSGDVTGTFSSITSSNTNIQTTINYTTTEVEVEVTGILPSTVDLTFSVDLSQYTGTFTTAYINGSFNGWNGSTNPLTDQGNGIWSGTITVPANDSLEYKFTLDAWAAQEGFVGGETCVKSTGANHNRFLAYGAANMTIPTVCWNSCTVCPPPPVTVDLTFSVDMSQYTGAFTTAYINGSFNGWNGSTNPLTDQGSGIWSTTITVPENDSLEYKFTLDAWTVQEMFVGGEPCVKSTAGNHNRFLAYGNTNMTIPTVCWESCTAACPVVLAKPDLPITFEDTVTINHEITPFGGNSSHMVVDPTNAANHVLQSIKTTGAQTWAGTTMGGTGLATAIPFSATATKMSVRVWSPDANTPILLKVEDAAAPGISSEVLTNTTVAGQWETLEFDFASGTPALNLANTYDKVSIFFDFNTGGTGKTYYNDDVMMAAPVVSTPDSANITFLVNTANITVDPTGLFLGGGVIGGPTQHQLSDTDGDGVYEVTIRQPKGFGGNYIFLNGNSGWGAKENLTGLPCADVNNFDDRILSGVWSDTTLLTCYETCATDTVCPAPATTVDLTFSVDLSQYAGTFTTAYINGSFNGWSGSTNPLTDQGNGIWSGTITVPENDSLEYKFTLDAWTAQEMFVGGEPCVKTTGANHNRFLVYGATNMTIPTVCWNSCTACTSVALLAPSLPVTFQDTVTIDHAIVDFGDNSSVLTVDPTDPMNTVVESEKKTGSQTWAGTVLADNGLASAIPFTVNDTMMSVRVWSPDANTVIRLKVEQTGTPTISVETEATTTVAGQWETLVFNFKNHVTGTAALDLTNIYDKVVIFFDFGNVGTGKTYYWDDVMMSTTTVAPTMIDLTFTVDMTKETTAFTTVGVFGDFNGWDGAANPMTDQGNNIWTGTITVPENDSIEYKFILDATTAETFAGGEVCTKTTTTFTNRFLAYGNMNTALDTVCFASCMACDTSSSTNQIILDENLFTLQPNLVSNNYTNIHFSNNMAIQQASIGVFNALGQQVSNILVESRDVYRMNVSNLPSGMYYVNVRVGNKMATKRMVIVK